MPYAITWRGRSEKPGQKTGAAAKLGYRVLASVAVLGLVFQLLNPSGVIASNNGSVKTVTGSCGTPVNANEFAVGEVVFIQGENFDAGSYEWSITGQPGSSDPSQVVASDSFVVDESGAFCFEAYTVQPGDDGVYKFDFGGKGDNYHVDGEVDEPTDEEGTLIVKKVLVGGEADFEDFSFSVDEEESTSFTSEGENEVVLLAGEHTVVETDIPSNWEFTSVDCVYEEESVGESISQGELIDLEAGEIITCTFTNTLVEEPPVDDSVTILADKVVCLTEADLPNWGDNGAQTGEPSMITGSTAADYVAASNGRCWLQSDWSFQWGFAEKENTSGVHKLIGTHVGEADGTSTLGACAPTFCGDNTFTGTGYADWKTFDTATASNGTVSAEAIITDLEDAPGIWVRENLQEGYVPFSYPPDSVPGSNISAEIYCHDDIQNYDNYDEITAPELDNTYHCVAFNAHEGTTILASKVVCLTEADLPNWGDSGEQTDEPSVIGATTAEDFVAANPNSCHLEEDWSFQWGFAEKENTSGVHKLIGTHVGEADGTSTLGDCAPTYCGNNTFTGTGYADWKTFDTATSANGAVAAAATITDLEGAPGIWVRENLQEGYVPFSYPPDETPGSNVSAEIYCHDDINNFDNYDEIVGPELGNTYYCVAFNALKAGDDDDDDDDDDQGGGEENRSHRSSGGSSDEPEEPEDGQVLGEETTQPQGQVLPRTGLNFSWVVLMLFVGLAPILARKNAELAQEVVKK